MSFDDIPPPERGENVRTLAEELADLIRETEEIEARANNADAERRKWQTAWLERIREHQEVENEIAVIEGAEAGGVTSLSARKLPGLKRRAENLKIEVEQLARKRSATSGGWGEIAERYMTCKKRMASIRRILARENN